MKAVLIFVILLLPVLATAQEDTAIGLAKRLPCTLKVPLFALLNPIQQVATVQLGIPLSLDWGIDLGLGYVFASENLAHYKNESFRGIKLEPALRHNAERPGGTDVSLVFKYINVRNDRYVTVLRQGRQYQEWLLGRKHRVTTGVALIFSTQRFLGKRERLIWEHYVGFGWRRLRVSADDLPPDAELVAAGRFLNLDRMPGIYSSPDFILGFRLGWVLGKGESFQ